MTDFNFRKTILSNGICLHKNSYALKNNNNHIWGFVHGMGCSSTIFKYWFAWAEEMKIPVCAIDLRGHGQSTCKNGDLGKTGIEDYVSDVQLMLDEIGPTYLIGHSQGALISRLVAERDSRVIKTVSVTSAQEAGMLLSGKVMIRMLTNPKYLISIQRQFAFRLNDKDILDLMGNCLNQIDQEEMFSQFGYISGKSAGDILKGIKIKKGLQPNGLIIGADQDQITPSKIQRQIAKKHGLQYVELEGACHMVPLQEGVRDVAFNHIVKFIREDR